MEIKPRRLTLRDAQRLAKQELGTSHGLRRSHPSKWWYHMTLGKLEVWIRASEREPDAVELTLELPESGRIIQFYRTHTLLPKSGANLREMRRQSERGDSA